MCYNVQGRGIQPLNANLKAAKNVKENTTLLFVKRKTLWLTLQKVRELKKASVQSSRKQRHHTGLFLLRSERKAVQVMLHTGTGSSYICTKVITEQKLKPVQRECRCIEQMFGTMEKDVEIYNIKIK